MQSSLNRHLRGTAWYLVFACLASIGFASFCLGWQTATEAATVTHPKTIRRVTTATMVTSFVGNTITVNSNSDEANNADGICTLREAIVAANTDTASGVQAGECGAGSSSGSDTISLSGVTGMITLLSALPTITSEMTLSGPGLSQLSISGNNTFRVFNITLGTGVVSFSGLTITNGRANMDVGGGIYNQRGADVNVTDSTVSFNTAVLGGGIANSSTGTFTITNSTLNNNSAGTAGGCYNGSGVLNIIGSTLNNNVAGTGGGSGNGGAINTGSNALNIINSTLHNNSANGGGGGIYNGGTNPTINVTNSTITDNIAVSGGGGINNNNPGLFNILNSIVAHNLSQNGPDLSGSFVSLGHNLISRNDGSSGFTAGTDNPNGDLVGTSFRPVHPLLGALQNNGGPTRTRALLPGSLAIDAGDNCVTMASDSGGCLTTPLSTDQRGVPRQVNMIVDIGAFESRGFTFSATSGTPQSTPVNTRFAPLVVTVSSAAGDPVAGGFVIFRSPTSGPTAIFDTGTNDILISINASGQASTTPTANGIAGGPYNATATINGIASSASFSLTNNQAATNTAVTSSSNPSDLTQSVTFSATVTSTGTPTGTVQFKIDGSNVGGPVTLIGGVATVTTSALTVGTHSVTADYSGDANFLMSTGTLTGGQVVRTPPTLSINDVSITEGDAGAKFMSFTVTQSAASNLTVTADFATANNSATAPSDYVAATGTVTFSPGQVFRSIFVMINGDVNFESNESLTVTLSNPVNASFSKSQGTGTILNDDAEGGFIRFSQSNYSVNESAGQVTVTVNRTNDTSRSATVEYATVETGATTACATVNGVASHRCDFTTARGTLRFASGETAKTFNVLVNRDSYLEGNEMLLMSLSNPTGGAVLITPSSATVTISDSATGPPANLIDDATVFVRQHYHDFLNREPDAPGLNFWANQITECESRPEAERQGCREVRRIHVSAAFFLSIEFQETGYFVYRLRKAAFGDLPGKPVPVTHADFLRDSQQVSSTPAQLIVNAPGWEQQLETNKQAFLSAFASRPQFATLLAMAPADYVAALNANTGGALTEGEVNTLAAELTSNDTQAARASVLRRVAENAEFSRREKNPAFVLMQYFGYLRRNPDDAPELNLDFGGYNFWLRKLNNHGGNYITAEMVNAFIVSGEYRGRFGQ